MVYPDTMKLIRFILLAFAGSFAYADDYPPYHPTPDHENFFPYYRNKMLFYQHKLADDLSALNDDNQISEEQFRQIKKDQVAYDNAVEDWFG